LHLSGGVARRKAAIVAEVSLIFSQEDKRSEGQLGVAKPFRRRVDRSVDDALRAAQTPNQRGAPNARLPLASALSIFL
jgi:hypothetical protein